MTARPRLLLCFDAFGTLFRPRASVAHQYGDVARQFGLTDFSHDELQTSLFAAVKEERRLHPNYGRALDLGATQWWTNARSSPVLISSGIIHKTFTPLLRQGQTLPPGLAPALLHRFSSRDGYETEMQTLAALRSLRDDQKDSTRRTRFERIVVGVITNSDDRVPDILSSLGVDVSPLRYGAAASLPSRHPHDVDFHCMSYDVGVEKPDPRIFHAAEAMLSQIIAARSEGKSAEDSAAEAQTWEKLYVGDEYSKDVVGARNAGWKAALLAGDESQEAADDDAPVLEDHPGASFHGLFSQHDFVTIRSIQSLVDWVRS